jgi:hypothetical protein
LHDHQPAPTQNSGHSRHLCRPGSEPFASPPDRKTSNGDSPSVGETANVCLFLLPVVNETSSLSDTVNILEVENADLIKEYIIVISLWRELTFPHRQHSLHNACEGPTRPVIEFNQHSTASSLLRPPRCESAAPFPAGLMGKLADEELPPRVKQRLLAVPNAKIHLSLTSVECPWKGTTNWMRWRNSLRRSAGFIGATSIGQAGPKPVWRSPNGVTPRSVGIRRQPSLADSVNQAVNQSKRGD